MKIRCPNCGSKINVNAKFCETCGTSIQKNDFTKKNSLKSKNNNFSKRNSKNKQLQDKVRCPECGLRQDPRVTYCKRCGTNLKNLPLEFPEDNSHHKKRHDSMPKPNMSKKPQKEQPTSRRFSENYESSHDMNPNSRLSDDYEFRSQIYRCPRCGFRLLNKHMPCPQCGYGQITTIKSKKPVLAAFLSLVIMGLGQLYNGQIMKAIGLFLIELICIFLSWLVIPLFILVSFYIYGVIDAYEVANEITERIY